MLDNFRQYLDAKISLTPAEWEKIKSVCIAKKLNKGEFLLQEGTVWQCVAIVIKGCLRTYRSDENGRIRILDFVIENGWLGDTQSLQTSAPSVFNIDAIEPSEIVLINKTEFEVLCEQIPQLNQMMTNNLKECLSISQSRIDLATIYTSEEKYRYFSTYQPQLLLRVPQFMIASYLGMTPESLSRIRKRLAKAPVEKDSLKVTLPAEKPLISYAFALKTE